MVKMSLQEFEVNDSRKGNYFYLRGEVNEFGFTGWSEFVVSEAHFKKFATELEQFAKSFEGTPEFVAGWGEEIYFKLRFQKWGNRGIIWVDGEIAYPVQSKVESNPPCSHRLTFSFPIDPSQLDEFKTALDGFMKQRLPQILLEARKD